MQIQLIQLRVIIIVNANKKQISLEKRHPTQEAAQPSSSSSVGPLNGGGWVRKFIVGTWIPFQPYFPFYNLFQGNIMPPVPLHWICADFSIHRSQQPLPAASTPKPISKVTTTEAGRQPEEEKRSAAPGTCLPTSENGKFNLEPLVIDFHFLNWKRFKWIPAISHNPLNTLSFSSVDQRREGGMSGWMALM